MNNRATRTTSRKHPGQVLVVTGMHRSGTSFVASLLRNGGVVMGDRLMPANSGNELGYFENLDFVEFHERWLRLSGCDPAGWAALQPIRASQEIRREALALIRRSARGRTWGWKDPRTVLFLDVWTEIVPDVRYIFSYREPSEVIDSLFRRGDASIHALPELAARAWLWHNNMLLRFVRANRERCILANVSAIARDPRNLLRLVRHRFKYDVRDRASSPFKPELFKRIDQADMKAVLLRHLLPECGRVFADLEKEADFAGGIPAEDRATAKQAREAFLGAWAASHSTTHLDARAVSDQLAFIEQFDERISRVREAMNGYDEHLAALSSKLQGER